MSWEAGSDHPALSATAVHVWHADLDELPQPLAKLEESEQQRAESIRSPLLRKRWVAARWALRRILAAYLDLSPTQIELQVGPRGKPSLCGLAPPLRFNLSHSGSAALIAVSDTREVGVDIERADQERDFVRLAEAGLDEDGVIAVRAAPPQARAEAFYRAWVRREAIVKCLGVGLGVPSPERPVSVSELDAGIEWAAAVAVSGTSALPTRCFSLCGA